MKITSSEKLVSSYGEISDLAHRTSAPIYITKDGEGDLVLMAIRAFVELQSGVTGMPNSAKPATIRGQSGRQAKSIELSEATEHSLGGILRQMYDSAPQGDQVASIHLFSIMYAEVLSNRKIDKKEVLRIAELPESYQTEISKGIKLAKYVDVKEGTFAGMPALF